MDVIIQARVGSSRFPNKIFSELLGNSLIDICINKLRSNKNVSRIIVSTTINKLDDKIEKHCKERNVLFFRGSENNVLKRFIDTCEEHKVEKLIRVCCDNPLLSMKYLNILIKNFENKYDYCSFYTKKNEPVITKPIGVFAEGVSKNALYNSFRNSKNNQLAKEHVTYYIHRNLNFFKVKKIEMPLILNPELRFTLDYKEDLMMLSNLAKIVSPLRIDDIMKLYSEDMLVKKMLDEHSKQHPKTF